MTDVKLLDFVENSLRAGAKKDEIEEILNQGGWSADQVKEALASFADIEFVVPVPKPKTQLSARDTFRYLIMFGMLYISGLCLGNLLFQFVNLAYPEGTELNRIEYVYQSIRWATSALIVSFPIYLFLSYRITTEIALDPSSRVSAVRRWLTYLTLAIAAAVIVIDLIVLVYNFLAGELSVRFILKILIVLSISGSVFSYYLWSNKLDDEAISQ